MSVIIDSSATLAWIYKDEDTAAARTVLDQVKRYGAAVPSLWHLEVANSLAMAVHRGRITPDYRKASLEDLDKLPIVADTQTHLRAWREMLSLADRFRLTLYDAAYLELAHRRALPLATLDKDLRAAAEKLGVALLGI